jgi:hypothetical protein
MARTPVSKIVETIELVEVIQGQIAGLTEVVEKLVKRIETLEAKQPR